MNLRAGHVEIRQTLQHIDGEWRVGTPKSKRSTREVPLPDHLLPALRRYSMEHPNSGDSDALLWPGRMPGTHVVDYARVFDVASFRRNYLRPALRSLEMSEMRFHDLRHTYASLALAKGVPLYEVSRYMGHSNAATTDAIYAHLKPGEYDTYRRLMSADAGR